jgi:CTP:molybdopterin cytidylyltransferase MocA
MLSAVVLAAGGSTRMGRHKLLLPLGDEPLVHRTVRQVCAAGADDVLVVLGREADTVRAALRDLPCRYAVNTEYVSGMGSSFRVAVEHLAGAEAAMFVLADQPFVETGDYRAVLDAWRASRSPLVCVRYGEVTAPPHLFAASLFPELAVLTGGARPVLQRHAAEAVTLALAADRLLDVDTPEDYERAVARAVAGGV